AYAQRVLGADEIFLRVEDLLARERRVREQRVHTVPPRALVRPRDEVHPGHVLEGDGFADGGWDLRICLRERARNALELPRECDRVAPPERSHDDREPGERGVTLVDRVVRELGVVLAEVVA